MNGLKKQKRHNFVVKSNYLVDALYQMSVNSSHLFNILLRQITAKNPITDNGQRYTINAKEFGRLMGIKQPTHQYRELKKAAGELFDFKVVIQTPGRIDEYRIFDTARYEVGEGYVSLAFARNFLPFIQELNNNFTRLRLAESLRLRKFASMRLYEQFMRHRNEAMAGWYEEDLDVLKGILGVKSNHVYWENRYFSSKVLNPAIAEIKKQLCWEIKVIKKKVGRRIVSVRFEYNDPNNGGLFGEQYQNRIEEEKKAKARELDQAEKSRQAHFKKHNIKKGKTKELQKQ